MIRREGILEAIHRRRSVRSYSSRPIEPSQLEHLLEFSHNTSHLTSVPPRITLVAGIESTRHILTHFVGSYGLVRNAPYLLVAVMPEDTPLARLDTGFVLEQIVLEATIFGLGTCWITGTYNAKHAGEVVQIRSGEVAGAVCSLGYAASGPFDRLHDTTVRRLARGHRRKPLEEIVFFHRWEGRWSPDDADPSITRLLDSARLAPSTANRQPWRFILKPDQLSLALVLPLYFDAGIVMAHVALAARELGLSRRWAIRLADRELAEELDIPSNVIPIGSFY